MKVNFKNISIENFFSIGNVEFDVPKGLVILLGENQDSSTADDNGSGKSSLAEAFRWVLYGETVKSNLDRSLGVDAVIRQGEKKATVKLYLDVDGQELEIVRTRTKSSGSVSLKNLTLKTETKGKAAQEQIAAYIGLTVVQFANLVHLDGDYAYLFASSTDATRKEILDQLIDLAFVFKAQDYVSRDLKGIVTEIEELTRERDVIRIRSEGAEKLAQDARARGVNASEKRKTTKVERDSTSAKLQTKSAVVQGCEASLDNSPEIAYKYSTQEDDEEELSQSESDYATHQKSWSKRQNEISTDISQSKFKIKQVQTELNTVENAIHEGTCFECGQNLPEEAVLHLEETRKNCLDQLQEAEESLKEAERIQEQATKENERKEKSYCEIIAYLKKSISEKHAQFMQSQEEDIEKRKKIAERLERARKEASSLSVALARQQTKFDTFTEAIREAKKDYEKAVNEKKEFERRLLEIDLYLTELEKDKDIHEFWKKGFGSKGVPSLVVELILPQITACIQEFADTLTGGDIRISLKAYSENKSGTVKEAIQIKAVNVHGASVYGSNSTGERSRIDLAVTLGLIKYFREAGVFSCNLLLCDEIFDGLDEAGVTAAIRALKESLIKTKIVVSHHRHLKPLFPRCVTMTKKNGVSGIL